MEQHHPAVRLRPGLAGAVRGRGGQDPRGAGRWSARARARGLDLDPRNVRQADHRRPAGGGELRRRGRLCPAARRAGLSPAPARGGLVRAPGDEVRCAFGEPARVHRRLPGDRAHGRLSRPLPCASGGVRALSRGQARAPPRAPGATSSTTPTPRAMSWKRSSPAHWRTLREPHGPRPHTPRPARAPRRHRRPPAHARGARPGDACRRVALRRVHRRRLLLDHGPRHPDRRAVRGGERP